MIKRRNSALHSTLNFIYTFFYFDVCFSTYIIDRTIFLQFNNWIPYEPKLFSIDISTRMIYWSLWLLSFSNIIGCDQLKFQWIKCHGKMESICKWTLDAFDCRLLEFGQTGSYGWICIIISCQQVSAQLPKRNWISNDSINLLEFLMIVTIWLSFALNEINMYWRSTHNRLPAEYTMHAYQRTHCGWNQISRTSRNHILSNKSHWCAYDCDCQCATQGRKRCENIVAKWRCDDVCVCVVRTMAR